MEAVGGLLPAHLCSSCHDAKSRSVSGRSNGACEPNDDAQTHCRRWQLRHLSVETASWHCFCACADPHSESITVYATVHEPPPTVRGICPKVVGGETFLLETTEGVDYRQRQALGVILRPASLIVPAFPPSPVICILFDHRGNYEVS